MMRAILRASQSGRANNATGEYARVEHGRACGTVDAEFPGKLAHVTEGFIVHNLTQRTQNLMDS